MTEARHTNTMMLRSLLSLLLPYRRTTEERARQAILNCGISPDATAWHVGPDGAFAFGQKHPEENGLTYEQVECLLSWTRRERIRVGFIAWETRRD